MGVDCKYNGKNNKNLAVINYLKDKEIICICPEQLAGMATPRPCAEIVNGVVTDENGNDKIEIRLILPITIAIDHRALDYGDVVPFMRKLDEIFDNPSIIQSWK